MKKYVTRATRWLGMLALFNGALLLIGIAMMITNLSNDSVQFGLILSGGLMSILFLTCYFAERSRYLVIDAEKIVFPRGANKNGKIVFRKTVIEMDEINFIESKFYKGNKMISEDCFLHTLNLKDGTKVTVTLYAYGKDAEKEILKAIQKVK